MEEKILKFYSRKDVQKKIVESSMDREVGVKYGEKGFGKRPDVLQYESDVLELAKQGATSFHISEERWKNPLLLESGMTKLKLDDLRKGWDCILDIDTKFIEYSKMTAELLIEALRFHDINNIGIKFSGGSGFHIGIPFESFPDKVDEKETRLLFPDGVRVVAEHLKKMIEEPLRKNILEKSNIQEISKAIGKEEKELVKKDIFDPFSIVEIDSVLISSRHMYRAPYSVNEKKGLVSVPLSIDELKNFDLSKAKIENVKAERDFLPRKIDGLEANQLIMQAFDALKKKSFVLPEEKKEKKRYDLPKLAVKMEYWPPCIKQGLKGLDDGKKRFLFILINFLRSLSWSFEGIEKVINEWNKKNKVQLKEGYIISQLNWAKNQKEKILPPNCANKAYYADIGIKCDNDSLCNVINNPVNYSLRRLKLMKEARKNVRKKKGSSRKKSLF